MRSLSYTSELAVWTSRACEEQHQVLATSTPLSESSRPPVLSNRATTPNQTKLDLETSSAHAFFFELIHSFMHSSQSVLFYLSASFQFATVFVRPNFPLTFVQYNNHVPIHEQASEQASE